MIPFKFKIPPNGCLFQDIDEAESFKKHFETATDKKLEVVEVTAYIVREKL